MRLREHPKIQWPPRWSEGAGKAPRGEKGILRDVDLIEPAKLLIGNEVDGKVYFAEIYCFNTAFASRLHEKIKPIVGRPIREVGVDRLLRPQMVSLVIQAHGIMAAVPQMIEFPCQSRAVRLSSAQDNGIRG